MGKRGHPSLESGRSPLIGVRLPTTLLARLDTEVLRSHQNRSEVIRRVLEAHLPPLYVEEYLEARERI